MPRARPSGPGRSACCRGRNTRRSTRPRATRCGSRPGPSRPTATAGHAPAGSGAGAHPGRDADLLSHGVLPGVVSAAGRPAHRADGRRADHRRLPQDRRGDRRRPVAPAQVPLGRRCASCRRRWRRLPWRRRNWSATCSRWRSHCAGRRAAWTLQRAAARRHVPRPERGAADTDWTASKDDRGRQSTKEQGNADRFERRHGRRLR